MTIKEIARDVVEHAPEDCSWDRLIDDFRLRKALDRSRKQSEQGEMITADELKREMSQWAKQRTA